MTIAEVKAGLLAKMQTIFPESKWKYYGMDVVEGFERPCFFTQLKLVDSSPSNFNSRNIQATFYINVMQKSIDEADALDLIQRLQDLFGLAVRIGDRAVHVTNMDYDFIGTDRNIPEISFDLEWGAEISHKENLPLMESAEIKQNMED